MRRRALVARADLHLSPVGPAAGARRCLSLRWRRMKTSGRVVVLARPSTCPVTSHVLSRYQALRRRVLFDVWFPGKEVVVLNSAYCTTCGFMAYFPRPTDEDVAAKYRYLKQAEPDIGGQTGYDSAALQADADRAARVHERCAAHLGRATTTPLRVLDYGGGNGKLLKSFLAKGESCYLIDYNDNPLPGVEKLCDDAATFSGDETFDLIICSHVLEHVSDVAGLVSFFRRRLSPGGLVYAEVPQEIWAGVRLESDPVTHINFFTENSLAGLFQLSGFEILEKRRQIGNYGNAVSRSCGWWPASAAARRSLCRPTPGRCCIRPVGRACRGCISSRSGPGCGRVEAALTPRGRRPEPESPQKGRNDACTHDQREPAREGLHIHGAFRSRRATREGGHRDQHLPHRRQAYPRMHRVRRLSRERVLCLHR